MASRLSVLALLFIVWTVAGWAVEAGDPAVSEFSQVIEKAPDGPLREQPERGDASV